MHIEAKHRKNQIKSEGAYSIRKKVDEQTTDGSASDKLRRLHQQRSYSMCIMWKFIDDVMHDIGGFDWCWQPRVCIHPQCVLVSNIHVLTISAAYLASGEGKYISFVFQLCCIQYCVLLKCVNASVCDKLLIRYTLVCWCSLQKATHT